MTEKEEIYSTRWTLGIAVIGFLWVIFSIGIIAISSCQLQVEEPRKLPSYIPAHLISDLQFSSSGDLMAAVESGPFNGQGPFVDVYNWDSTYRPARLPKVTLDFGQLTGRPTQPILTSPFTTGSPLGRQPSSEPSATRLLPYAFSEDGSMVAWSWEGVLFAGPLQNPKQFRIPLDPRSPVVALSFFDRGLVGVIHSGGEFRLERFPTRDPNLAGTELRGAWRISGRGPFRVLSNFGTGDGILVKPEPRPNFRLFPVNDTGTFITVSKKGKVAMGTSDGVIIFPWPFRDPRQVFLPEKRRVQTLAFRDEENLIASTEAGSLFLVEDETRPIRLTSAPRGVRLVAVSLSRIALVTSRAIVVADLKEGVVLSEAGKKRVAGTFYILSLIVLFRLIFADCHKLRSFKRKRRFRLRSLKRDRISRAQAPPSDASGREGGYSTHVSPHDSRSLPPKQ